MELLDAACTRVLRVVRGKWQRRGAPASRWPRVEGVVAAGAGHVAREVEDADRRVGGLVSARHVAPASILLSGCVVIRAPVALQLALVANGRVPPRAHTVVIVHAARVRVLQNVELALVCLCPLPRLVRNEGGDEKGALWARPWAASHLDPD
eukprot:3708862-Prymnesium_polylepis.1